VNDGDNETPGHGPQAASQPGRARAPP
jgi:hypothetical protein